MAELVSSTSKFLKSIAFVALAVTNTLRNFPEMVRGGCFEAQAFVFAVCAAFNLLYFKYSSLPALAGVLSSGGSAQSLGLAGWREGWMCKVMVVSVCVCPAFSAAWVWGRGV